MTKSIVEIDTDILSSIDEQERTAMPVFVGSRPGGVDDIVVKGKSFAEIAKNVLDQRGDWEEILKDTVRSFFANGGELCYVLLHADLKLTREINHVVALVERYVPDGTLLSMPEVPGYEQRWEEILKAAANTNRLFCLIDMPNHPGDEYQAASAFHRALPDEVKSVRAAYWPRLQEQVIERNTIRKVEVAPSGAVAAAIQRTDATAGVWGVPAGVKLPSVLGLAITPEKKKEPDFEVNTIRIFPGRGALLWGARTLATDPKNPGAYVQTKRTMQFIQHGLQAQLREMVFEVNDALLWRTCEARVTVWLTELWRTGGLAGATAKDAFQVHVGEGVTMTLEDIAQGKLIIHVTYSLHPVLSDVQLTLTMLQGESRVSVSQIGSAQQGGKA
ncbi:hypothetical protein [Robbsia andropogonis]|uniref:hypothetical protein n=1 Tax=Robbsia andropogonis TaxID=28092 RepID=UPI002A6B5B58|nr:hypothetical protein [Robbsia andropogonis]